jgi:hypothetical protein
VAVSYSLASLKNLIILAGCNFVTFYLSFVFEELFLSPLQSRNFDGIAGCKNL